MVRTHHEQRGIVDSVCEAPSQPEKPFEVRKTSSGQSTFVKPWDRRFKQHSLEITCGVPVDWRLGNFNNVTLYIPPDHSLQNPSYQQHSHWSARQSTYRVPLCAAQAGRSSRHGEFGETQPQADLGQQKKGHCPWPQQCWQREDSTLQEGPLQSRAAQGTTELGMQPGMTQNSAPHPRKEKEDPRLRMAKCR